MLKKKSLAEILNYAEQLSERQQLELISRVSIRILNHKDKKIKTKSWMEMAGLGAEVWRGIDVQDYINKERESWER
ncbi:MAG: hypothetical protein V1872_13735 [bacterium]